MAVLSANNTLLMKRSKTFALWIVASSLVFAIPLIALVRLSLSQDNSSYLVLIPFISAWVLFVERDKIFFEISTNKILGGILIVLAGCCLLASYFEGGAWPEGLQLSGYILSLVLLWVGGFSVFFGRAALKAGYFPLLFLFLTVPLPNFILNGIVYVLQTRSADLTDFFFRLLGVPVLREGLIFHLARVSIEVSQECSGIRSSMALFILALLVTHFYLRSFWKKVLFLACGLVMMIIKNGIRIVTLTLLAMYVDPGFLTGRLHRDGGVVFFLIGLFLLLPLLWFLQRGEAWPGRNSATSSGNSASNAPNV